MNETDNTQYRGPPLERLINIKRDKATYMILRIKRNVMTNTVD